MVVDESLVPGEPEATARPCVSEPWTSTIASAAAIASGALAGWLAVERSELFELDLTLSTGSMLVIVVALALCVALVARPGLGLLLLLAVTFLNLSQVLVRAHGLSSLLQLLAVPLLLTAWQVRGRRGLEAIVRHPLSLLLLGWALVLLFSSTVAIDREVADQRFLENLKALYICLLVASLASTPRRLRWGFAALVACGAFLAGLGVWQVLSGELRNELGGLGRIKYAQIYGEVFEPRITGPFGDPNYFAQILLLVLPFALLVGLSGRARRTRFLALAATGLLTTAVALTYSRGGALTLACVLVLTLARWRVRWPQLLWTSGLVALVLTIAAPDLVRRLATIPQILPNQEEVLHPDSSFEKRRLVTAVAWEIWSHNPVLGVGAANYDAHFEEYANRVGSSSREYEDLAEPHFPHNLYLEIGAETGIIGLAVFGSMIVICFTSLRKSRRLLLEQGDEDSALLARGCEIALTGYLVSSLFLHGHFQRPVWALFGMVVALSLIAFKRRTGLDPHQEGRVEPDPERSASNTGEPSLAKSSPAAAVLRRPVAVLVSRFPLITETFILRELIEMERQGQPVVLVPLIRERPEVVHASAVPWVDRALYTPFLSPAIVAANLRYTARHPVRTLALWVRLAAGTVRSPGILLRTLALLPKSVYLAERLPTLGVHHLHAHFATYPTTSALIIASQANLSFSFTIHAHDIFVRRNLHHQLLRRKIEEARFVRVISEFARHHLAGLFPKETRGRLRMIRVGIESRRLRPSSVVAVSAPQPARILCVAGLKPYKGLIVLLRACATLKQRGLSFRCQVVGEGPERSRLARYAKDHDLDGVFELLGARSEEEVARLLAEATVFALPSLIAQDGQMEGIPVALMEAMTSGVPVVASRLSGIPELVEDGVSGLLVKPGDVAALAEAIERLSGDAQLRSRLAAGGRRRVEGHFRLDRSVSSLLELVAAENDAPLGALGETIAGAAQSVFGPSPVGLRQVHRSRDATVAELLVGRSASARHSDVIVKIHRSRAGESRPPSLRARHEYGELARLDRAFATFEADPADPAPKLGVPRPLHLDERQALLVMKRCPGRSLQVELHASRGRPARENWARVRDALCYSGQWLRRFQEFNAPNGAIPTPGVLDRAIALLGAIPRLRPAEPWVEARLRALGDAMVHASAGTVGRHGDFRPSNIFVSDRSLEVIDLEGSGAGLPFEDVATLLVAVDLTLAFSPSQRMAPELEALFLKGYLGPRELDRSALAMSRAVTALELLAKLPAETHLSWLGRFRRRFTLRRILRRSLGDVG